MNNARINNEPSSPATGYTVGGMTEAKPCCEPVTQVAVRELAVSFHGRQVLGDVSIDIPRGCITALIGPSGCGKTTFLSCLNRMTDLYEGCRVSGTITLDGHDIHAPGMNVAGLRRHVGMVFQRPNPFPLSIHRNLDMPLREHGVRARSEREGRIEDALRQAGLWEEVSDRLGSPALALSGGQQQRLCIARAIVLAPAVLLMDEPCSALDPLASARVEELITELRGKYTVVLVTHNLAQARRVANFAAFFWMTERIGKLIEFGQCSRVFEQPSHQLTAAYVSGLRG